MEWAIVSCKTETVEIERGVPKILNTIPVSAGVKGLAWVGKQVI